jgi:hypothetical protein
VLAPAFFRFFRENRPLFSAIPRKNFKDWLLGFEGTKEKCVVMQYTITRLGKWDKQRASEPNAVHFCSTACQNNYLCKNYGNDTWAA